MKKTIKLCALLVAAATAIAVTFTGCPDLGFGKDDLYGKWMTLDFDDNGNPLTYYAPMSSYTADTYLRSVEWEFDGSSENMFSGDGGCFWQHLIVYERNADGTPNYNSIRKETYWHGEYDIKGNSSYSKGKLYLFYEFGYEIVENGTIVGTVPVDTLRNWTKDDYLSAAGLNSLADAALVTAMETPKTDGTSYYKNNHVYIQVRENNGKKECGDIEYFRFNLKDGSLYGYTRLMATIVDKSGSGTIGAIYNQCVTPGSGDAKFRGGKKTATGCSWTGQTTRYMGRISVRSTPTDPTWMYSNTTSNDSFFNLNDTTDQTNYVDPDGEIKAEE